MPPEATQCPACGFHIVEQPKPFEEGTTLEGRYRVDHEVGRGGMGVVYRGTDLTLNRPVAIKAMRAADADATVLGRFLREARSLARIEHAGVVPVYAVGQEGGTYYMVMKFIEGQTLQAILKEGGALDAARVRALIVQVCDALGALHRNGLIHRDMKPGNLIVGGDGRVTVMDLGIVKAVGEHTSTTSTALGTPKYMAPESLSEDEIDHRSDLYSLGIIAWQCLAGEVPFDGATPMAILYKQAHEPPPPLKKHAPDTPRDLVAAVDKALEKDPEARFADAEDMAAAIRGDAPVAAAGGGQPPIVLAAAAVLLLAMGAGAWLLMKPAPTPPAPPTQPPVTARAGGIADAAAAPAAVVDAALAPPPKDAALPPPKDAAPVVAAKPKRPRIAQVSVRVVSDPAGAQVYIGGRRQGRTPLTVRLPQSSRPVDMSLKREGYRDTRARVKPSEDRTVRVKLDPMFELIGE
jgi:serine/threonine-protein kinase